MPPNPGITPEQAAEELLRRKEARRDPAKFCEYCLPFRPVQHHKLILDALTEGLRGGPNRVAISMPPGFGKSNYASWAFPAFALGVNGIIKTPFRVIGASHTQELANIWSQRVRDTIEHREFLNVFLFGLKSKAVEYWETTAGGEYVAVGIGTGIAGRRANLAVVDDPYPDAESAESQVYRDKVWRWYLDDLSNRLLPNAMIVLIQTRWHEDDLSGRLFNAKGGDKWRKIIIPYEAKEGDLLGRKPGEPLWSEFYSPQEIAERRELMTPRSWASLWQQEPVPESGDFFQRDWIKYYDTRPDNLRVYMAADYAVTKDGGDYTVFIVGGVDEKGDLYILDLQRMQESTDKWIDAAFELISRWEPLVWVEESGPIWRAVDPFIVRRMHETQNYQARKQLPSIVDKKNRARAIQGRMSQGKVLFPRHASWLAEFEREVLSFDAGKHDDQVDALALMGRMLHTMTPAQPKEKTAQQKYDELVESLKNQPPPTLNDILQERERQLSGMRLGLVR